MTKKEGSIAISIAVMWPWLTDSSPGLDPADWPLMCITAGDRYYMDVSLPFSLRWAATCFQDVTAWPDSQGPSWQRLEGSHAVILATSAEWQAHENNKPSSTSTYCVSSWHT